MSDTSKRPDLKGTLSELVGIPIAGLEPHPLADTFPLYVEDDFINDIRDHGVRTPIVLYEGKILDGRSRVAATKKAGMTKIINTNFEGSLEQARDFVISMNLARRHLDVGQRAMIAAELATLQRGSNPQNCGLPAKAAAKQLKVSIRSVETARAIHKADPALAAEVKEGKTKLSKAAKIVAKRASPKTHTGGEAKKSGVEIKRHDERMKSARYKLEAFVRDYSDIAEWKEVIEAIKAILSDASSIQ